MNNLPPITRHLLLINIFCWIADFVFARYGVDFSSIFGLHFYSVSSFHFWQPLTYMFMHANLGHIFCNMFAVWMFGPVLEREWGSRKFLIYYLVCGLGAALVQEFVWWVKIEQLLGQGYTAVSVMQNYADKVVTIGASGAVFGILLAFGWLFPDVRMFLLFIPIPIRARTFVIIYAVFELIAGLAPHEGDNVAHFAHLGGMLFGWLLLLWWKNSSRWTIKNPFRGNDTETDTKREKDYSDYHYQRRIDDK